MNSSKYKDKGYQQPSSIPLLQRFITADEKPVSGLAKRRTPITPYFIDERREEERLKRLYGSRYDTSLKRYQQEKDESSKTFFEREDISVKQTKSDNCDGGHVDQTFNRRSGKNISLSDSSSHVRYPVLQRSISTTEKPISGLTKRRTPDKTPYFLDERREEERLKRLYGSRYDTSHKRDQHENRHHKTLTTKRRINSRSPTTDSKTSYTSSKSTQSHSTSKRDNTTDRNYPKYSRNRSIDRASRRSTSKERSRKHHSSRHHSRSRSYSRTKSRSHERNRSRSRSRSRDKCNHHNHPESAIAAAPATQIITIPVPVDSFGYTAWPPHPAGWSTSPRDAYYAPYPPMMALPRFASPAIFRPPRYGSHLYNAPIFRPRFPPRQARGHYRPRYQ